MYFCVCEYRGGNMDKCQMLSVDILLLGSIVRLALGAWMILLSNK